MELRYVGAMPCRSVPELVKFGAFPRELPLLAGAPRPAAESTHRADGLTPYRAVSRRARLPRHDPPPPLPFPGEPYKCDPNLAVDSVTGPAPDVQVLQTLCTRLDPRRKLEIVLNCGRNCFDAGGFLLAGPRRALLGLC